jgi:hypothetical protein
MQLMDPKLLLQLMDMESQKRRKRRREEKRYSNK